MQSEQQKTIKPITEYRWTIRQYPSGILISHAKELGRFMLNCKRRALYAKQEGQTVELYRQVEQFVKLKKMLREIQSELRERTDWR